MEYINLLGYRTNRMLNEISNKFVGCCFDPARDITVITGGAKGLGKEVVVHLRSLGAKVAVLDIIKISSYERIDGALYYQCDVRKESDLITCRKAIIANLGVPTVLINNAAIALGKELLDMSFREVDSAIMVNLLSSFYTTKLFLPDMLAQKRGYIVTVASVLGLVSPAQFAAYGASKAGLFAFHESLTYELGSPSRPKSGVKTLLLCPGQLKTDMFQGVETPSQILAPELEPARVASFLVEAMILGRRGELKLPLYAKIIPVMRTIPWPMAEVGRKLFRIDSSARKYKGTNAAASELPATSSNNAREMRNEELCPTIEIVHSGSLQDSFFRDVSFTTQEGTSSTKPTDKSK